MEDDKEMFERMLFEMEEAGIDVGDIRIIKEIGELTGSALLTNMEKEEKELVLQVAKKTGIDIYIEDEAFDRYGKLISKYCAVYTRDIYKDHSPLWDEIKRIKKSPDR
jgi:hypothetical protein